MSKSPENSQHRISNNFSKRIKRLIEENDCANGKQFAELIGVSEPVISKAVNYGIIPSLRTLIKFANTLELSLNYVLGLTEKNDFVPSANPSTFYMRLEELCTQSRLNYGQLAAKMTFPRTYVYEWISEKTLPSLDYVFEMANFFNVSPDYLLGRSDYRD